MNEQSSHHMETIQMIFSRSQLIRTLGLNELKVSYSKEK